VFGVEWWPVAGALTLVGLVLTVLLWRRRGAGAGMRMLGASFLPGAIVLVGLQGVLKELWKSLVRFVTGLLFSPQIWVGVGMAVIAVICILIGNRLTVRKLKQVGTTTTTSATGSKPAVTGGAKATSGSAPKQVAAKNPREPTGLEGMEDIDEILKRRGIN
jgi:hypothetical protein